MRRHRRRPRRSSRDPHRTRPVPRLEEHVRRCGVPAHSRRTRSALVGNRTDPTLGRAPFHHGALGNRGSHRRLPQQRLGRTALQRCHRLSSRFRRVVVASGRGRRRSAGHVHHRHRSVARCIRSRDRGTHRSPRRRPHRVGCHRVRRSQFVPRQRSRSLHRHRSVQLHTRCEGDPRSAQARDRRTLRGA